MNKTDRDASIPRNVQLYAEDGSGQLIALKSDLSGQLSVDVTIGDIIAIISGHLEVYSGEIHVVSGSVTLGSGGNSIGTIGVTSGLVSIQSGSVSIQSGEVHVISGEVIGKVSGETVSVASGAIINRNLLSGLQTIVESGLGTLISGQIIGVASGIYLASGLYQASGVGVTVQSGVITASGAEIIWRGIRVSGTVEVSGTVISKVSGETVTIASGHVFRIIKGAVTLVSSFSRGSGLTTFDDVSVAPWVAGEICIDVASSYLVSGAYLNLWIEGKDNTTSKYKSLFTHSITSGVLSSSTEGTTWDTVTDMIFDTVRARHAISGAIGGTFTYQIAMQGRT